MNSLEEFVKFIEAVKEGTFRGKILISGDGHGSVIPEREIQAILEREKVSYYLSTGDVCHKPNNLEGYSEPVGFILKGMAFVSHEYPLYSEGSLEEYPIELPDNIRRSKLFLLFHGHDHMQGIWRVPKNALTDYMAHTRIKEMQITVKEGVYRINPGCVSAGEFAILDLSSEDAITLTLYKVGR